MPIRLEFVLGIPEVKISSHPKYNFYASPRYLRMLHLNETQDEFQEMPVYHIL